jgi:hypothetical protein
MNDTPQNDLDKALAGLSREINPPRNLWPQIAAGIEARRRPRPILMAACVAALAACLASVFTWAVLRKAAEPSGLSLVAQQNAPVFNDPTDPKYLKARADLEKTFNERLALLDPSTRVKIEASLQTIRKAREDIRKALQADPASSLLEDLWQSTSQDEIDLYDRVVQTTDPSTTRS